ncbi:MAG: hypothetical protein Q8835_02960, partial [Sweet potato little leaf phytoplasma]|nr:hypothetical protein [Sweet potato little leaf phytoplasma]
GLNVMGNFGLADISEDRDFGPNPSRSTRKDPPEEEKPPPRPRLWAEAEGLVGLGRQLGPMATWVVWGSLWGPGKAEFVRQATTSDEGEEKTLIEEEI